MATNIYDTVYFRKEPHLWTPLANPSSSVVYNALVPSRLNYVDDITDKVLKNKDNDEVKSGIQVRTILANLVKDGFVGEVHGIKLEKFLKTF